MMVDEFLAWERRQELKYEFDGLKPVAMTGGSLNHSAIALGLAFNGKLQRPYRFYRDVVEILVSG